jgi:hypothetical protein
MHCHWKERFVSIKHGLATILAETMPKLAPSLGHHDQGKNGGHNSNWAFVAFVNITP